MGSACGHLIVVSPVQIQGSSFSQIPLPWSRNVLHGKAALLFLLSLALCGVDFLIP